MDQKRMEALKARDVAEAEEFEARASDAAISGRRSARLGYTFTNLPSNEERTVVHIFGSRGYHSIDLPPDKARRHVKIINEAYDQVDAVLDAYLNDDNQQAEDHIRELVKTLKSARRGRPRLPKGKTKPEQVVGYLWRTSMARTLEKYPELKASTIERYEKTVSKAIKAG
jgi:hypothetical protein